MTWRCANRRRKCRLHLACVDYLGDVPNEPLLPMRPVYMPQNSARCFACRRTHLLVAGLGAGAMAALGIIYIATLAAA